MSLKYQKAVKDNSGKALSKAKSKEMYTHKPRVHADGKPKYFTEQAHKNKCDINSIIAKYNATGLLTHVNTFEAASGDLTQTDYQTMLNKIITAKEEFSDLPSNIRKRFGNDPGQLLGFMENPNNRKEAEELGIINPAWTEETDGLGEHITDDSQRKIKEPTTELDSEGNPIKK